MQLYYYNNSYVIARILWNQQYSDTTIRGSIIFLVGVVFP